MKTLKDSGWNQATSDRLHDLSFPFSDEDGALSFVGFQEKMEEARHF